MKKHILLSMFAVCIGLSTFGQITLEHTYAGTNFASPVLLSANGEKYMTYDTANIYLYNTDHSLWKTIHASSYTGYKLQYALATSDHLFNSDDLVELVAVYFSSTAHPYYRSEIINENTVIVQDLDSNYYANVHYNSNTNTYKLFAQKIHTTPTYYFTSVYAVPGTIPCGQCGSLGTERTTHSTAGITVSDPMPNPSSGSARISYQLPVNTQQATISFYNMAGQLVKELPVLPTTSYIDINNSLFRAGEYTYFIRTDESVSETRIMIVQ